MCVCVCLCVCVCVGVRMCVGAGPNDATYIDIMGSETEYSARPWGGPKSCTTTDVKLHGNFWFVWLLKANTGGS